MGKSRIVPRVIRIHGGYFDTGNTLGMSMQYKGRATEKGIENYITKLMQSTKKGGSNYHLAKGRKVEIAPPSSAEIYDQRTRSVVAKWKAPMLWVY
jgi:hypothetical protein